MKHKVTLPWNAAAWRQSTYEPREYSFPGPVALDTCGHERPCNCTGKYT
jgi:hypothetical protein